MNAKDATQDRVAGLERTLVDLSHRIHAHPELGFEEEKSSAWVAEASRSFSTSNRISQLGSLPARMTFDVKDSFSPFRVPA